MPGLLNMIIWLLLMVATKLPQSKNTKHLSSATKALGNELSSQSYVRISLSLVICFRSNSVSIHLLAVIYSI